MNDKTNQAILLQINQLRNLPALPEASIKILDAINNPHIEIDQLANILSTSPGLVARILGLANSAYFGQSRQINELSTAIYQVLGLELVKSLTLGIILNVQFDTSQCRSFDTKYFWSRCLLTAVAAQKLATRHKIKEINPTTAYTCGLLLYIGMLVLAYLIPDKLDKIFLRSQMHDSQLGQEICIELGASHYHIGCLLLQKWQLSPLYQTVLLEFENPNFAGQERSLINLLTLSHHLSSILLKDEEINYLNLEQLSAKLSLSTTGLTEIVDLLRENRENIENLATILGN